MNIAEDCQRAAEEIERALEMSTLIRPIVWTFGLLVLLLFVALYLPW
ncbi:type II secretory pathway component PulF [Bradyrhizobium sp. USDA 4354]